MKFLYTENDVRSERFFVYTYNMNDIRIVRHKCCRLGGFEAIGNKEEIDYNNKESERVSLSRTRRNIREIALCNNFDYFLTITINSQNADRFHLDEVQNLLKKTLKKIKRKNKDFEYIIITEKHKDGAFHFHGLCNNFDDLYTNENGYLSSYIISDEIGYNSFSPIKDYTKVCNYITKYITKDCIKNSHNQVYISSKGLKKASREEFKNIDFIPSYSNEYCDILDIQLDKLSQLEKIELFNQLKKENFKKCSII